MLDILSINFPLIGEAILIALIVLAFFMWYLTREILRMENILLYSDIIFTIVWTIASTTSIVQAWGIPLFGLYAAIFYYVWLAFAGFSASLALISYLMFIKKYLRFKEIERKFNQVNEDYNNNYITQYDKEMNSISQVEDDLKTINSEISEALNMLEDARRAPEKIILNDKSASQAETIPAQLNTVVIGLGGVGTALVSGIGIQTGGESSYLKTSILDNLITKNVIRDGNEPFLFILYDTNGNNIDAINKKYNDKLFSNIVKTFTYQNSWTQAAMTNTNPYLVGLNFNLVNGAGNNRIVGIAAYNTVRELFLNDIKNSISQLIGRTHKDKTVIYIINSWGGGTGSGTFIKFAQDLKEKLSEIPAFQASPPYIYGIGVLPAAQEGDIYKANAYGAFKEMSFIMQPEQNIIGEVQKRRIRNPFNGYLLVSRDITNQTKDIEISTGISNLIIDLSTTIKEQGQQLRFDTTDIETRFRTYSPNNFSTFEFYNIYFPASILSWYKVIGEPKSKRLNETISNISKNIDKIKNDIKELQTKADELSTETKNLSGMLTQYNSERPYKSFIVKINNFQNQNNNIITDIGPNGKIDIRNLSKKVEYLESEDTSKENNFPNTKQKVGYFVSVVNSEEARLRYPSPTGISYSFSVNPEKFALPNEKHGPEKIDIGVLTNPQYNLLKIIQDLGKEDELANAYNSLQKPLGQAGPLLTLNYANIGLTMNIDLEIINFIREVNPGLLQNLETNPSVKRPSVGDIVILPSTNPEILNSDKFPTQEAFRRNLLHSATSVEYGQSSLPFKKYSITNYRILFNVPLNYYSPDEDPMMPIIRDYRNSYKNKAANNYKSMLVHHTLLYDVGIEGLRNLGIEIDPNEIARDQVTGFWVNYEPFIGEEYTSKLYTVLSYGKLYKSINQIKELINNEVFGEIQKLDYGVITVRDLANIQNKINGLSAIIQNLMNNINRFKESFENIERIYKFANDDFKGMMDNMKQKVSELYAEIGKAPEQLESDINVLNKKLDELYIKFDSDKKITERNNIKKIKESLNDLSRKLNPVINGYSEIFSNF